MPRVRFLKWNKWELKDCPKCGLRGGMGYCRRCHGPRKKKEVQ